MSAMCHWLMNPPFWDQDCLKLLPKNRLPSIRSVTIGEIIAKSDSFPIEFPIDTMRMKTLQSSVPNEILKRNVQSAYPIMHESVFHLCAKFLAHKVQYGTAIEKDLYTQMTVLDFIERLLTKRAVMFVTKHDQYILMDGTNKRDRWETIGTNMEEEPLLLKNYLSYDEIKISAFLSVSSFSYFINNGSRYNDGRASTSREDLADEGVIIGLVGTRLERRETMEFQEIVITKNQNTVLNGYGGCSLPNIHNLFAEFYGEQAFLYENIRYGPVENVKRFTELSNGDIFDNCIYAKRLSISFDTLLIEANHRAKEKGTSAYVHVVGIGLGAWRLSVHQEDVFVETFGKRLSMLGSNIQHVSDVHFAYFPRTLACFGCQDGDILHIPDHPASGIKIHISEREPNTKLSQPGKLLVITYAWDGNSLPGNEFWKGFLGNSGDSAAAVSSQIAELHNPHINQTVCADNLKIATRNGLITVQEYIDNVHKT